MLRQPNHDLSGTVPTALWVPSTLLYIERVASQMDLSLEEHPTPIYAIQGSSSPAASAACDSLPVVLMEQWWEQKNQHDTELCPVPGPGCWFRPLL